MKQFPRVAAVGCSVLVLLTAGCSQTAPPPPPDTHAADEAAVRAADTAWSRASEAHQIDALLGTYADDAITFGPGMAPGKGKDAIRKIMTEAHAMPGFSLTWTPEKVEVAKGGELAYSRGAYQMTMKGANGEDIRDHGTYLAIWKKPADGKWRVVEDIATSEAPAK